jgi:hypothetical protein
MCGAFAGIVGIIPCGAQNLGFDWEVRDSIKPLRAFPHSLAGIHWWATQNCSQCGV